MAVPCIVLYKGKRFTKEEFMNELMKGELDQYLGRELPPVEPSKPEPYAIQEPSAAEGMLRQERPELGLQEVVQGDQGKTPAGPVTAEAEVKPTQAELSPEQPSEREAKKQQLRDEISQLTKEAVRKAGLTSGGPLQSIPEITKIVAKYAQLGMMNIEDIAQDLIERGYSRLLPRLKKAYNEFVDSAEGKAYGLQKIKDFDHQKMIDEAIAVAKAEAEYTFNDSIEKLTKDLFPQTGPSVSAGRPKRGIVKTVLQAPFQVLDAANELVMQKILNVDRLTEISKRSFEKKMMSPDVKTGKAIVLDMINTLVRPISEMRYEARAEKLYGQIETGKMYAASMLHRLHEIYGIDNVSAEKVHKVLDPEFYKVKSRQEYEAEIEQLVGRDALDDLMANDPTWFEQSYMDYRVQMEAKGGETLPKYDDLTDNEKAYYDTIRAAGDAIHSANMMSDLMSLDTYTVNKGKYIARMYESIERKQAEEARGAGRKQDYNIFKTRDEIDEWKMNNRITDPSYLMAKRMQQSYRNKAVADYALWVRSKYGKEIAKANSIPEPPENYVQLGGGYGVLSNKYVPLSIAEDFKGFQFISDYANNIHNALKAYDNLAPRRFYKRLFTEWNPATQISNYVSNIQFALLMDIDPITYNRNIAWANGERKTNGADFRYLLGKGLLKTAITSDDYITALNKFEENMDQLSVSKNPLKLMKDAMQSSAKWMSDIYSANDDNAKMAAWKTLVEMGVDKEEAIQRVSKGLQNYTRLPKSFDLAAKTPFVGGPFARFKSDLGRIILNNATRRPFTTIGYLYLLNATANAFSAYSGESKDERKIREGRKGAPKIPFVDIPLTWKVGGSELNIARYLAPYYTFQTYDGEDVANAANKFLPYDYTEVPEDSKHPEGPWASWFGMINKDPLTQALNLAWDADYQGRPISDPSATNYKEGISSSETRAKLRARYLFSSYMPYGRYGLDLYDAVQMQANPDLKEQYTKQGKQIQTVGQAFARMLGVKLQQVPEGKYKQMLESQVRKVAHDYDEESKKLTTIRSEYQSGKMSKDEAMNTMAEVLDNLGELTNKLTIFQDEFKTDKYKEMQQEFFDDYDGYNTSVRRYLQAKEDPETYIEMPPQKGGGRRGRRSSGFGGFNLGGLGGFR